MTELREKMIRAMELKNLSPNTVKGYLTSITTLSKHYKKSPDKITHEMVEDFLLYLKKDKELESSTLNAYAARFKFFYNEVLSCDPPLDLSFKKRRRNLKRYAMTCTYDSLCRFEKVSVPSRLYLERMCLI